MITNMKIKIEEEDPVHSTEIQEMMEDIEEGHEIEIVEEDEKEKNIKEHLGQNQTLVLSIVHTEDTIDLIQEEGTIETPPPIGMVGLAPEINTSLITHPQIKDDQKVGQEILIMVEMGQGKKGMIKGGKTDIEA